MGDRQRNRHRRLPPARRASRTARKRTPRSSSAGWLRPRWTRRRLQRYRLDVDLPAGLEELWLEEIDTQGKTRRHGPFVPGQVAGVMPEESAIDWSAVRAELTAAEIESRAAAEPGSGPWGGAVRRRPSRDPQARHPARHPRRPRGRRRRPHRHPDRPDRGARQRQPGRPRGPRRGPTWNAASAIELYWSPALTLWSPYDVLELRLDATKARAPRTLEAPLYGAPNANIGARLEASPNQAYNYGSPNGDPSSTSGSSPSARPPSSTASSTCLRWSPAAPRSSSSCRASPTSKAARPTTTSWCGSTAASWPTSASTA